MSSANATKLLNSPVHVAPATFFNYKGRLISTMFSNFTANQGKSEVYASPSRNTDRQILLPWRRYPPMGHSSGKEIQRFRATDAEIPRLTREQVGIYCLRTRGMKCCLVFTIVNSTTPPKLLGMFFSREI